MPDRAVAQDQRLAAEQLALARRIAQPRVAVLCPHHFAVAFRVGQHQHHDIFGNRHRIDSRAIGQDHPALGEQIKRETVHPGIDRIEPFEPHRAGKNLGHVDL